MAPRRNASATTRAAAATTTSAASKAASKPASKAKAASKPASKAKAVSKPAATKKASKVEPAPAPPTAGTTTEVPSRRKRKLDEPEVAAPKKTKVAAAAEPLNAVPTQILDVFVFGQGENAELGLGSKKYNGKLRPTEVRRPRVNHNLDADKVGVVHVACGGMHAVALTRANKILSWGVNDDKALGRDTTWNGGLRDADAESDSEDDDDDSGLNPLESTPAEVDMAGVPAGVRFVKVQASNSASFALTTAGQVYGWGTFRGADGIIGFLDGIKTQPTPILIPHLAGIKDIAAGSDHVLALDKNGRVLTWGSGGQFQLGRRPVTRRSSTLKPEAVGRFSVHKAVKIFACGYQSFYIDNSGKVWSWGLNNYGQTGHAEGAGEDGSLVLHPKMITALETMDVNCVAAGSFHGVASTTDGKLLTWGRIDGHQVGHKPDVYTEENTIYVYEKPRILVTPTVVPDVNATFVSAASDTSFAITADGKAYSWGFSSMYQTGQGTDDDVEEPTLLDNTAVKGKKIVWAGAGGQFAMLTALHGDAPAEAKTNGVDRASGASEAKQ